MPTAKNVAKTDTKPSLSWDLITQAAIKAQKLATDNAAGLGTRLTPAFLTAFAADIIGLGLAVPATITAKKGAVQLTAAQLAALVIGHNVVNGIRKAVKGHGPEGAVQLAYSVGIPCNKLIVKSVRSALDTIGKRIAAQPAEAAGFGITADDAAAVAKSLAAIDAADQAAGTARATAPQTTKARNATARRLVAGTRRISGASMRAFADNPTLYASFKSLTQKTV